MKSLTFGDQNIHLGDRVRLYDTWFSKKSPNDVIFDCYYEGIVFRIEELLTKYSYHIYFKKDKWCANGVIYDWNNEETSTSDFYIRPSFPSSWRTVKLIPFSTQGAAEEAAP